MKQKRETRDSGIELLRIVLMLQIIMLHIYDYGNYSDIAKDMGSNHQLLAQFMWSFFRTPVDVFILISGYFMVNNQFGNPNYRKRIIRVYTPAFFYSVVLGLICMKWYPFGITHNEYNIVKIFTPFFSKTWYFISIYLMIMILAPFVNITLTKLNKRQYLGLIGILGVFLSIWPNLSSFYPFDQVFSVHKVVDTFEGKSFISLGFLYIIGGYLRRFLLENKKKKWIYLFAFIGFAMSDFILRRISVPHVFEYNKIFGRFDNPLVICAAVSLFLFFREINFKSRIVNSIAGTTFGIYMIHEFPPVRDFIWRKLFDLNGNYHGIFANKTYVIKLYGIMLLVFVGCMLLEYARQFLFAAVERLFTRVKVKTGAKGIYR